MAKASAALTINFGVEAAEEDISIDLSLDEAMNVDAEGEQVTKFYFGDTAYLKTITSRRDIPTTLKTSWGKVSSLVTGEIHSAEDLVTFANEASGRLTYPAQAINRYEWWGNAPAAKPVFSGSDITFSAPVIGIMKVYYNTLKDIWALTVTAGQGCLGYEECEAMPSLVVARQEDASGNSAESSLTVDFWADEAGEAEPVAWDVLLIDECNESPLAFASVTIYGVTYETSPSGQFTTDPIPYGVSTTAVIVTNEGYRETRSIKFPDQPDED